MKYRSFSRWVVLLIVVLFAGVSFGVVPVTDVLSVVTNATWTNANTESPQKLIGIEAFNANATTGTVTITRISGTRTNSVGSITLSAGAGTMTPANTIWLEVGDQITAVMSGGATTADLEIVKELGATRKDVLTVSGGSGTWQNSYGFQAQKLISVEAFNANATTGTVTIARIAGTRTSTVGTITLSGSAGRLSVTNTVWVFPGDSLRATMTAGATNAVIEIVKELGL